VANKRKGNLDVGNCKWVGKRAQMEPSLQILHLETVVGGGGGEWGVGFPITAR